MEYEQFVGPAALTLIAVLAVLALRPFWAWYTKANEAIKLQREILNELRVVNGKTALKESWPPAPPADNTAPQDRPGDA